MAIEFTYPPREIETNVIEREAGVAPDVAQRLVKLGEKVRNLRNHGLEEGVSTRLLIYALAASIETRRAANPSLRCGRRPSHHRRSRHATQHSRIRQSDLRVATARISALNLRSRGAYLRKRRAANICPDLMETRCDGSKC